MAQIVKRNEGNHRASPGLLLETGRGTLSARRPALYLAAGGSGLLTLTHMKAFCVSEYGGVPPWIRFLGFDVMEEPPVVRTRLKGSNDEVEVRLEPGVEYGQIGSDCDPARLGDILADGSLANGYLREVIERQPGGRFVKSILTGTQGERIYGLLAFRWSTGETRRLLRSTLRELNDLRLPGADGAASTALQVIIVASIAGGVGSAIALPLCGEVKRAMNLLGMDVNRSIFIGAFFTPDCFPETELALANAWATLNDFNIAQKEGVTPLNQAKPSSGRPFDLLFLPGSQTERGKNLRDISDVAPVVAKALLMLGTTPMRDDAAATTNNIFRNLEELTAEGEPNSWGSLGIVDWVCSGEDVATYFANRDADVLLSMWEGTPGKAEPQQRLSGIGHAVHMGDLDELMLFVQEIGGKPRPGEYRKEATRSLRASGVKAKALPDRLRAFEETFEGRIREAVREARQTAANTAALYVDEVAGNARQMIDEEGYAAGIALAEEALRHGEGLQRVLEDQRRELAENLHEAERDTEKRFAILNGAAQRSRTGWIKSLRKPLDKYLGVADVYYHRRHGFDLTEAVLSAVAEAARSLRDEVMRMNAAVERLELVRERCRRQSKQFEERTATPVTEIICRPLCNLDQLHRLYEDMNGVVWESVPAQTEVAARQSLGRLSKWIDQAEGAVYDELIHSLLEVHRQIAAMTANDFAAWLRGAGELEPALFMRDSEALAAVLCRYDRARLPDGGAFEGTAFRLLGVPDRDNSLFSNVTDSILTSTGNSDRLTFVVLKLGFPAAALWHYQRYLEAHEEVKRKGRIAQEIYPGFPYENGAKGQRERRRRQA